MRMRQLWGEVMTKCAASLISVTRIDEVPTPELLSVTAIPVTAAPELLSVTAITCEEKACTS